MNDFIYQARVLVMCLTVYLVFWLRHCATRRKAAGSFPNGATVIFLIDIILPAALWPWD
jgi:hypothetical protein